MSKADVLGTYENTNLRVPSSVTVAEYLPLVGERIVCLSICFSGWLIDIDIKEDSWERGGSIT